MNQLSLVPFGSNINVVQAYGVTANDRLGKIDLIFENCGNTDATIIVKEFDRSAGSTNGIQNGVFNATPVIPSFVVKAQGTITKSLVALSKRLAFFGSGGTVVSITGVFRNPANLRGAQFDIELAGRNAWGWDASFDINTFTGPIDTL